jgi:Cadherin domain/RTX calcium-binding nonapeptide repeat (4 copies)
MVAYVRSGTEISVNTTTTGDQQRSSMTKLSDGSLVVVWQSSNTAQDGNGGAVLMRRFSAAGVALGSEILVNTAVTGDQTKPQVTALIGGGYVVTWETSDTAQDGNGTAIKGQVFSASGTAIGSEFRANTLTTANQQQPTVAGLADGSFVIAWQTTDTTQDGSGSAIKAQRFGASGTVLGSEFRVNTTAAGSQVNADIAILNDGRFVVSWQDGASGSSLSHAQVYNGDGTVSGVQINVGFGAGEFDTAVAALSDGGFVLAYHRLGAIFFQRYDANRAAVGGEVSVGSGTLPEVSALTEGGFVVAWRQNSFTMSARAFSATGTATSAEFLLAQNGSYASAETSIVSLTGGGFAATWTDGFSTSGPGQEVKLGIFQPVANVAPELGAPTRSISVAENLTAVTTIVATDDGGPSPVTYSIFGGADASRFTINATTGALSFVTAPNFEAPTDAGANNVYDVIVRASDGDLADTQAIAISVTNVNEAPVITSDGAGATAALTVNENTLVATNVFATDVDSASLTYTISGGLDAALFSINATTGVLSFVSAPDFESPADNGANNVYNVTVRASDGVLADTQALTITVVNVNDAPIITSNGGGSSASITLTENTATVTTVTSTDPENALRTYAIAGGADSALFAIDAATGALSFVSAPNFEAPADAGANNVYDVIVSASDGVNTDTQALAVTVTNVNEGLMFTSATSFGTAENATAIGTVSATDIDGDVVSYAVSGGADASLFTINAATGALSFVSAPNFEAPADVGGDNVYDVIVSATDGSFTATSAIAVTVGNANEGVSITSGSAFAIAENGSAVTAVTATDIDGDPVTYAISGGADAALFAINAASGALAFVSAPNFEAPGDAGGDNVYDVIVTASDGSLSDSRAIVVTVANVNEGVSITSGSTYLIAENGTAVATVTASDVDGDAIIYSIAGGADAALFAIDATTGALTFISAPNFEAPSDTGADNVYDVTVRASDGTLSDTRALSISVTNANEGPLLTSGTSFGILENGTVVTSIIATDVDGDALTYTILGGADAALFSIDSATGALHFNSAPNFEAPADANGNNVYELLVAASDGSLLDTQSLLITVGDVNEAVTITSGGGGAGASVSVSENGTAVSTVTASDPENAAIAYAISGGADAARFTINPTTGVLSFIAAPNFEAPTDANGDNIYDVTVTATDGVTIDSQALAVTVINVNEAPVITSNGGGDTAAISIAENGTTVTTVTSGDPEGAARVYSIAGGADAAKFVIDTTTGALSFVAAPNYEAPTDVGANNVYDVIVQASDGSLIDTQALAVTVTNVNEAPVITSNGGGDAAAISIAENGTTVTTVTSGDPEGTARVYSIAGGADAAKFVINTTTGALAFVAAPNFEAPTDVGANNVYDVIVQASDGSLVDTQALAVTVTNVNEAPVITSNGGGASANITINENTTAVTTVTSTDPEGTARTYAIAGGSDAAKFAINATTGVLTFIAAPNYEAPTDVGANNVYDVIVRASDGTNITTQALAVTIANVVDGSTINGTSAANTLVGTVAEDTINGLGGNDNITGGAGADTLTGGTGADTFVYNLTTDSVVGARDIITDFSRTQLDKISLNPIDANANVTGNQNFTFIGTAAFSNVAGQLRYEQLSGNTFVSGDVNGDSVADFSIQVTGLISFIATDFVL